MAGGASPGAQTAPLPSAQFSTADFRPGEGWDIWCERMGVVFDISLQDRDAAPARVDVEVFQLDQLVFGAIDMGGARQRGVRSARKARRDQLDHYVIELYTRGGNKGETPSGSFEGRTGTVNVTDLARPLTVVADEAQSLTLTVPRPLLDAHLPAHAGLHGLVLADGPGGFLADYLLLLHRRLPQLGAGDAAWLSRGAVAMVAACLAPSLATLDQASVPMDSVLLCRVARFIETRLGDPDLSALHVCVGLGVSRSRLYRLFEPHGGVAQYIQGRRLEQAHAALLDPRDRRRISDLAYDHGFVSAAHFSRSFHRRFGCSPSEVRGIGLTEDGMRAAHGPAPSFDRLLEGWLPPPS